MSIDRSAEDSFFLRMIIPHLNNTAFDFCLIVQPTLSRFGYKQHIFIGYD